MNALNSSRGLKAGQRVKTYGQLKLGLIQRGLFIPPEILENPDVACGVCPGAPGEEVALALAENFIVKTILRTEDQARMKLNTRDGGLFLNSGDGQEVEVGIIPLPGFLKDLMKKRTPFSENICLDGYCLNIFLRAVDKGKKLNMSTDYVLSIVQSAFEEGAADLVQLNMDYCDDKDRGFQLLSPIVEGIKKKFKTFVALKGFPPQEKRTIDLMYAAGFDLLDFPLGGFAGSDTQGNLVPAHQVNEALEYAVGIFPQGTVWTELILGTESQDLVRKKIDHLIQRGIVPQLKLLATSFNSERDFTRVKEVAQYLRDAAERERLTLKWLYPNCRCLSPLDTKFFTEESKSAQLATNPIYRSRLGKKASEGFAAFRRKLRIKNISDSYESAGL
ncbi:MAG: hypothetical protein NPINA01_01990 [Nitrospinaceae bacterium]|nr:MAG: hypothetical protein NPINA01_01990 [Nitrospinaceae bacterium]